MLTKRQNLYEVMHGGNPDRFVNQYEAFNVVMTPQMAYFGAYHPGMPPYVNDWGVTNEWPEGTPGAFPVHTPDKVVIKDITKWRDYIKAPKLDYPDEEWLKYKPATQTVDRNEVFATYFIAPGIFEQLHNFQGMDTALINLYEEPEYTHEIIDFLVEWELEYAEKIGLGCREYTLEPV